MKAQYRSIDWLILSVAVAFAGCTAKHYEIELKPMGESIEREITCWEQTSNEPPQVVSFSEDELKRIAAAYHVDVSSDKAEKHRFVRKFAGSMPNDIGGAGSYTHWNTPLGSVSGYVERFRGNDDLLTTMQQRQEAADRLVDLLIGWLSTELEDDARLAQLRAFLDNQFRQDMKNISLYSWACGLVSDDEDVDQTAWLVRVGQYLVERSYFSPEQLPQLARAFRAPDSDDSARLLAFVQRFTASKMGITEDQPIPPSLQVMSDVTVLETSANNYLRQTDEFKRLIEEWERTKATAPEAQEPEPNAVVNELMVQAFLPNLFLGGSDQLSVRLALTNEPFATNGQWDEKAKHVRWSDRMLAADSNLSEFPTFLYAMWSEPNDKAQKEHFGRVVLEGTALGEYCLWYRGLSDREAKEWDSFVSSLESNAALVDRIRSFQFTTDSELATVPRDLILAGLNVETDDD